MKPLDKVKAFVDDKYIPGIVQKVEDHKGFKKQYDYQKVWVEFLDERVIEFREYDLIPITNEPKEEVKEKPKKVAKSKQS